MATTTTYLPIPNEIIVYMCDFLSPNDLYNFMVSSRAHYELIMSHIPYFSHHYAHTLRLPIERFFWSMFNFEYSHMSESNKFIKFCSVHTFTNTNLLESIWEEYYLEDDDKYGPLPTNPVQLHELKYKTGILHVLNTYDVHLSGLLSYSIPSESFPFFVKFSLKYNHLVSELMETIEDDFNTIIERGITFEQLDEMLQNAMQLGGTPKYIFMSIVDEYYNEFVNQISYDVDETLVEESLIVNGFSDEELETYKAVQYIIGKIFAHEYILTRRMNINDMPNFLEHVVKLRSIGITEYEHLPIVDAFIDNPTDERFENICIQMVMSNTVDLSLI